MNPKVLANLERLKKLPPSKLEPEEDVVIWSEENNPHGYEFDENGHIIDEDFDEPNECPHGYCIGADCPHLVTSLSGIDSCDIDGLDNEKYEHDINGFE